jgi:hypothetical protein
VGAGRSLEAAYTLTRPVGAGTLYLVADGMCLEAVDVTYDIVLRSGGADTVLGTIDHHWDPLEGGSYMAQPFEVGRPVEAPVGAAGDELILRFTGTNSEMTMAYVPNGDGASTGGRIPYLDVP